MYGIRVSKTDVRVEAYGTVDELNAALGLVRATTVEKIIQEVVLVRSERTGYPDGRVGSRRQRSRTILERWV